MKYNFDEIVNRRDTNSLKWDVGQDELPMWVADMDFKTAPEVISALENRVSHGIFGYADVPEAWYDAYINWWSTRHNIVFEKEYMMFCTGVVAAISSIVRKLTTPAEKVVIQTPVYNIFYNSIINNGRLVFENELKYENGIYSMDFDDLEKKLSDPQTTLMILCNPQNPAGKIWDRESLIKVGELCHKYNVTVLSDEIHCDLTDPGKEYIPFASASEICKKISITCIAPTKTFNIAGIQTACIVVADPNLRHRVWRGINTDEVAEPNVFAIEAVLAAYEKGALWLDELREYIYNNKCLVADYINNNIKNISLVASDATYLLWLDCSNITDDSRKLAAHIRSTTGLYISAGASYGEAGRRFLRMNIACPKELVKDGLKRLEEGIKTYRQV